jgi:hypothetical protein
MDLIREAGFPVYPLLIAGILSIRWAVLYARSREPEHRFKWLGLTALTLCFGLFGSALGLQASVQYISSTPEKWLFLIGLRESLHNTTLALGFVILDLLILLLVPRRAKPQPQPDAQAEAIWG